MSSARRASYLYVFITFSFLCYVVKGPPTADFQLIQIINFICNIDESMSVYVRLYVCVSVRVQAVSFGSRTNIFTSYYLHKVGIQFRKPNFVKKNITHESKNIPLALAYFP